ncbi:hypothetical protein FACS1894111_12520 [Clostridia bacterium]|nr:hypothetical protein FACS1894111_12520 [Clostridia bacterium]
MKLWVRKMSIVFLMPIHRRIMIHKFYEGRITFEDIIPVYEWIVEQAYISPNVIWQTTLGEIYQTTLDMSLIKLCESLCEYVDL